MSDRDDDSGDFGADALLHYLSTIEHYWNQWIESIDALTDEQMLEPGTCGFWSVKDLLGHIATWDTVALEKAQEILSGSSRPPSSETLDAFNDRTWQEFRDRSLPDLRTWMLDAHAQMVPGIEAALHATDEQRERIEWATVDDTWKHYEEHRAQIAARFDSSV